MTRERVVAELVTAARRWRVTAQDCELWSSEISRHSDRIATQTGASPERCCEDHHRGFLAALSLRATALQLLQEAAGRVDWGGLP